MTSAGDSEADEGVASRPRGRPEPRGGGTSALQRGVRFACLDGYRALAALAVVAFHVLSYARLRGSTRFDDVWMRLGNYGVSVFFLLSGFLLWRPFVVEHFGGPAPRTTSEYLRARLARLGPAYWTALAALLFSFGLARAGSAGDLLTYAGFAQTYRAGTAFGGLAVAWTLCVEASFYVLLPVLAWGLRRWNGRRGHPGTSPLATQLVVLASLYLVAVLWRSAMVFGQPDLGRAMLWLPAYLDWFALGMLLAVAHTWVASGGVPPRPISALAASPWLCWLFALGLFGVSTQLGIPAGFQPATPAQTMGRFLLNGTSALLLLVPGVLGDQHAGPIRRALRSRPLVWLGSVSYGIYLWHTIWLRQVEAWVAEGDHPGAALAVLATVVTLTLVTATISFEMIEKPALRLGRRPRHRHAPSRARDPGLAAAP